jgi:hypothetical protein
MRFISISKFAVLAALIALSGCTKKNPTSEMTISIPNFAAVKGAQSRTSKAVNASSTIVQKVLLSRLMVNISSSDIQQPIVSIWQRGKNFNSPDPSKVTLSVPVGDHRLIQVLAIVTNYSYDSASGETSEQGDVFYYGDVFKAVSGDAVADVSISSILSGNTSTNGSISGRYLADAVGSGPTGRVDIKYTPPSRPDNPMIVTSAEIHGGWFEFVAFEALPLSYWFEDGHLLMNGAPDVTDRTKVRMRIPAGFKQNNGSFQATDPLSFYFGYFGPGATPASYEMCFSTNTAGSLPNFSTDALGSSPMGWIAAGAIDSIHAGIAAGGTGTSTGFCPGGDGPMFANTLGFNYANFSEHASLGFFAPYRIFDAGGGNFKLITATYNAGTPGVDLQWAFLPGSIGPARVSGVEMFWRKLAAPAGGGGDKAYQLDGLTQCDRLTDSSFLPIPFQSGGRFAVQGNWGTIQTGHISGMSATDFNANKVEIVACPYSDSRPGHFKNALTYPTNDGSQIPATNLMVSNMSLQVGTPGSPQDSKIGACTPIFIRAVDGNNNLAQPMSQRTLQVDASDVTYDKLYTDSSCSSPGPGANPLTVGMMNQQIIYVKSTRGSTSTGTITVTDISAANVLAQGKNILNYNIPGSVGPATQLATLVPASIKAYSCVPITYQLQSVFGGGPVPSQPSAGAPSVFTPTPPLLTIYPTLDCSGTAVTGSDYFFATPGMTTHAYSMIYTGATSPLQVAPTDNSFGGSIPSMWVVVSQPDAAAKLSLNMPNSFQQGICQTVSVSIQDSSGNPTPSIGGTAVTLASVNGGFFASSTACTSALDLTSAILSTSISATTTNTALWFKDFTPHSPYSVSATAAGLQNSNLMVTTTP